MKIPAPLYQVYAIHHWKKTRDQIEWWWEAEKGGGGREREKREREKREREKRE